MNCKQCGGSTTPKQTPKGQAFECNQDNGDCYGPNGYPTTTWAQSRGNNGGGFRRAPAQQAPPVRANADPRGAEIKWQTCLKCASQVLQPIAGANASAEAVINFARKLYAAKPTVARPAPKPAPVTTAEMAEDLEEEAVF